jgi:protein lysine acetyltransferase
VTHSTPRGPTRLALLGADALVGELGLLTGRRRATVTALTDTVIDVGEADQLVRWLEDPEFGESFAGEVADRLASLAAPVVVQLSKGGQVTVRPGLASDRTALDAGLGAMSRESLRRRFFSGGMPPQAVVDRLADLDYVDHFAWVAIDGPDAEGDPIGSARYFRSTSDPEVADVSFGIIDAVQGRGIGRVLVEAIGVAAGAAGIRRLTADVLSENAPMRALLRRPSTRTSSSEPGVLHLDMDVAEFGLSLAPITRSALEEVASSIVWHTASLLAGTHQGLA